jgi:tetratricopeptide (TPR) repeat protein
MANLNNEPVFQLIKSLSRGEKRHFRMYMGKNTNNDVLKTVLLFDVLDKQDVYDEKAIFVKKQQLTKLQLPNLKAALYKNILESLRIHADTTNPEIQLNEQINNARILFQKGLYLQSLKIIEKVKEQAQEYHQLTYLQQALFFEKKIESNYITRSFKNKADDLSKQSLEVSGQLHLVTVLSNLALQLYSWYIKNGFAQNSTEAKNIEIFFKEALPAEVHGLNGFYEKLYFYQSFCWKAFIVQDFLTHYRYSQKWVDLYYKNTAMQTIEAIHFIKGMHNLMTAYFYIGNYEKLHLTLQKFEAFRDSDTVRENHNNSVQCFLYHTISLLNKYFLLGSFDEGIKEIERINGSLKQYSSYIDKHRVFVIDYKIACIYFGAGQFSDAIDYLNKIINNKADLRTDLQCYARLLHLIAHFEIGNFDLLEYLAKSVYRYMAKMQSLNTVEEALFLFLRKSLTKKGKQLNLLFKDLLKTLDTIQNKPFERRGLIYLDVVSWLQSKIENIPVQQIIQNKFKAKSIV